MLASVIMKMVSAVHVNAHSVIFATYSVVLVWF